MNSSTIIKLANLGLDGDKKAILSFLRELAADSSNKNRIKLYGELRKLLSKYEDDRILSPSSNHTTSRSKKDLWFTTSLKRKLDRVLTTIDSDTVPDDLKSKYNKVLLYGPPGSGKTTIGHYIAKKLNKDIKYVKLSDVISYKFGETLKNLAAIFEDQNDSIIFIDEFDAFAKSRFDSNDVGELKRIVNSLIQTLDLLSGDRLVIGATNLKNDIDPAILRRFPIQINVPELNKAERLEFFNFMSDQSEKNIKITATQMKLIEEMMLILNLKTIDAIRGLFDATIINAHINKRNDVGVADFFETMITDGILDSKAANKMLESHPDTIQKVFKVLGQNLTKTEIADFMGVHRNSVGKYAK